MAGPQSDNRPVRPDQDSYAPVVYDVLYSRLGETFTRVPFPDLFQSLSVHLTDGPIWTGSLALWDKTGKFVNGPNRPGLNSRFRIKWWWGNRANEEGKAPTFDATVGVIHPTFAVEGVGLTLDLTGGLTTRASFNKDKPPREFEAGLRASDIVRRICLGLGWPISVIETSFARSANVFRLGGESPQQFIMDKLLTWAHAKPPSNEHFKFYTDETGGVHFHSPSYLILNGLASNTRKLAKEYVAYAYMVGEVESFSPHDNSLFAQILGAGDGAYESVSSANGVPIRHTSTVGGGVNGKGCPPGTPDERNVPNLRPPSSAAGNVPPSAFYIGLVARTAAESEQYATALNSTLRGISYTADLNVVGTHGVRVNDYVSVRYFTADGTENYMSGVFKVNDVVHALGAGGWKTQLVLFRNGTKPDAAEPQVSTNVPLPVTFGAGGAGSQVSTLVPISPGG